MQQPQRSSGPGVVMGRSIVAVLVSGLLGSCGDGPASPPGDAATGGDSVVWSHDAPGRDGMDAEVRGEVSYRSDPGCFLLEGDGGQYPVVWPHGSTGVSDGPGVELRDGGTVRVSDQVSGGGGYLVAGEGGLIESFDIPAACLGRTDEVAVFNASGTITVDPS